jgi:nucleoside-diphosphate-sugar epimerase
VSRVLVTGATGFTARYVVPLLEHRGHEVREFSSAVVDVRDARGLREQIAGCRPEYVIHLAGTANLPDAAADVLFAVNVEGTRNLLEACAALDARPRKVILASSCYVYGDTGPSPATEDALLAPAGVYGRSKVEMERVAAAFFGRLPILILRPFNYSGVGHSERFLLPKLVRVFREGAADVSFVAPNVVRDFSDVRWVAQVYAGLLDSPQAGQAVNVCSGIGTPLRALVTMLEELTRHRPHQPARANHTTRSVLVGNAARLRQMGMSPSPYSLRDTLAWMLNAPRPGAA